MAQFKILHVLLVLFAAVASADLPSVALCFSNISGPCEEPQIYSVTTVSRPTSTSTMIIRVKRAISCQSRITTSDSKCAKATVSNSPTAGADAVRTAASSREWISALLDTVVMSLLALSSIVVAIVLGRKQLRAMRVQLQIMLDIAHRRPRANHVETNDLESQIDPGSDPTEVRSEITAMEAAQQADLSDDSTGFFPKPQPHVVEDDQLTRAVGGHGQTNIQPRRLADGDGFSHDGSEHHGVESLMPKDTPRESSCSQRGCQDPKSLDLNLNKPNIRSIGRRSI